MHNPPSRMDPAIEVAFSDARIVLEVVREWELMSKVEQFTRQINGLLCLPDNDRPHRLRELVLHWLSKRRGAPSKSARNQAIVDLLAYIQQRHGINPTRNRATRDRYPDHYSGCVIISRVLKELGIDDLKETGVEEVLRNGPQANPDWIPRRLRQAGVRE